MSHRSFALLPSPHSPKDMSDVSRQKTCVVKSLTPHRERGEGEGGEPLCGGRDFFLLFFLRFWSCSSCVAASSPRVVWGVRSFVLHDVAVSKGCVTSANRIFYQNRVYSSKENDSIQIVSLTWWSSCCSIVRRSDKIASDIANGRLRNSFKRVFQF
jgi:hypothetical protein